MPLPALPIDEVLPELLGALRRSPAALLRAPTGAGKTTRVPGALLDAGLAGDGEVVVLEPRRLAARAAARRTAAERGARLGGEVGYRVRFDARASRETRLVFVTEGLFLRRLAADPLLEGVGAVVFDEFHERSLEADLALALARRVQQEVREDLRLVVMSATLETRALARYLGDAPVVESAGRAHPVELHHLSPAERPERGRPGDAEVVRGVERALAATWGDVLVFLPGVGEIRRARRALEGRGALAGHALVELHGSLAPDEQDRALEPRRGRTVFLATNVAEASITLPGVTAVVDTGLARRLELDPATGLDRLVLAPISHAAATQRAGRAGRTGPGACWRLWTEHDARTRPAEDEPAIRRVDLAPALLSLVQWGEPRPLDFPWLEAPPSASAARALELLTRLGAVEEAPGGGLRLSSAGAELAALPVHPRLGRLLLEGARRGVLEEASLAAALVSERSPFRRDGARRVLEAGELDSDLHDGVHALQRFAADGTTWSAGGELVPRGARELLRVAEALRRDAPAAAPRAAPGERDGALARALLAAYPDRVVRRRAPGEERGVMVGGRGVRLARESAVREAPLFLALEVDAGSGESLVRRAAEVRETWLDPARVTTEDELTFDAAEERVVARRVRRYLDLELDSRGATLERSPESAAVLARAAADDLPRALDLADGELSQLRARLACLRAWRPELLLPEVDEAFLAGLLPELCRDRLGFAELRRAPLREAVLARLDWGQREALDREAPERLQVPSGSRLPLVYEPGRPPVLAARIQELFGWRETPRVAGGRVPVLLHLLAPNHRPQQVTDDLASFWSSTYAEVRKELRRRYPKHDWPEDPWTATASRRPGGRGKR